MGTFPRQDIQYLSIKYPQQRTCPRLLHVKWIRICGRNISEEQLYVFSLYSIQFSVHTSICFAAHFWDYLCRLSLQNLLPFHTLFYIPSLHTTFLKTISLTSGGQHYLTISGWLFHFSSYKYFLQACRYTQAVPSGHCTPSVFLLPLQQC